MKYIIQVVSVDPFTFQLYTETVCAYQDKADANILWYDDAYGIEHIAYLNEHPEAKGVK